ncbi:hypothetical protein, partial [Terriglobus sp. ADX1]|uniref:hypothetical protein n=1 Tax=Terriglobus sp. ADX1 TaxID=2794063 RepID=UPI002FE5F111
DGSEIYRIAPDGTPLRLVALQQDVVYALTVRNNALFAATGNRAASIASTQRRPTLTQTSRTPKPAR